MLCQWEFKFPSVYWRGNCCSSLMLIGKLKFRIPMESSHISPPLHDIYLYCGDQCLNSFEHCEVDTNILRLSVAVDDKGIPAFSWGLSVWGEDRWCCHHLRCLAQPFHFDAWRQHFVDPHLTLSGTDTKLNSVSDWMTRDSPTVTNQSSGNQMFVCTINYCYLYWWRNAKGVAVNWSSWWSLESREEVRQSSVEHTEKAIWTSSTANIGRSGIGCSCE